MDCCAVVKRYYAQLHSLQSRFPLSSDTDLLSFAWRDIYSNSIWHTNNIKYEMAAVLYNVASLHSKLGVEELRVDPESMKLACTHFQCAAWAFGEIKNQFGSLLRDDLAAELLIFKQQICFAQAQECILEKSLADNRKAAIIAKVTAQVISFYNAAMTALFSQNEDGITNGTKVYKEWSKYIKFKISYLSSVLFLYQGQHSEEQRKMGERLALFNAACERLEEAKKEVKGMNQADVINEAMVLATDIIEGKRKNAKQENEFIYHEAIPEISSISAVQGANLVQGIPFDVTDGQVIGDDIFKRLVPMKAHENLSLYSEEKANILRRLGAKIDERDTELALFMGSLNMDLLNAMKQSQERLPQNLVDRCAELSAKPNAIPDLVESMSNLANICTDVEMSLNEIRKILDEEGKQEQNFQKQMGKRPTGHMTELTREFNKYSDAHSKASESNDTLRKAMELHVSNLKILAQPLVALRTQVPQSDPIDESVRKELETLLNKVEEMKTQRDGLYDELRDQILNKDDITAQLLAHGEKDVDELFKKELKKYSQSVNIIDQNLVAQGNILKALTDTYAKHALTLKAFNDVKAKREQFYAGLIGSFDVYEDLIGKSSKGLDFYKKLHGNITKLMSRVKAARDVQDEERQQLLKNAASKIQPELKPSVATNISMNMPASHSTGGPKLKDYIKSGLVPGMGGSLRDDLNKLPAVRPSPLGQENISVSNPTPCSTINYPTSTTPSSNAYNAQYMQQYYNNMYAQQQQQQQQFYQKPTDQKGLYDAPSSLSSSSTSLNSDYYNNQSYNQQQQQPQQQQQTMNQGYVNPIYQQPSSNQNYQQNMNMYSQMNYGNQQQQQQSTAAASNLSNTNNYYNRQVSASGVQQPVNQNYAPSANQPVANNYQHPGNLQQNYASQNYEAPSSMQAPQQQNPPMQMQNVPQNQIQQTYQTGMNQQQVQPTPPTQNPPQVETSKQQVDSSSYGYSQNQAPTGEFIKNIYKSQLQYPTVQNSSQFPTNTSQLQYSTPQSPSPAKNPNQLQYPTAQSPSQFPTNQYGSQNAGYQTYGQYGEQFSQQNYSCYTPVANSTNSYMSSMTPQPHVTESGTYLQKPEETATNYANESLQNQTVPINASATTATASHGAVTHSTHSQQNQVTSPLEKKLSESANIDLLSGIDFSVTNSSIDNVPTLTPLSMTTAKKEEKVTQPPILPEPVLPSSPIKMNADLADLDFASMNEPIKESPTKEAPEIEKPKIFSDPFENVNTVKQFHKEVEGLERYMDSLIVKTLSGITPLANKWKELQDLLVKDESSRSISVAKLFPEKNRFADSLPYDHGRVLLPTSTDNYINAVLIRDCGSIPFIMAQTPMENTINDWWEMVWSQKSNVLVCLHSSTEVSSILYHFFKTLNINFNYFFSCSIHFGLKMKMKRKVMVKFP